MLALQAEGREIVLCGDWNIAHREIDLKNWKSNQKNSGFLPEERAWLSQLFDQLGWVDVYRRLHPDATDASYTWWSNRGQAWAKNVGWRIDYHIATPGIAAKAQAASIFKAERFSDHAPLIVDYQSIPAGQN
jgi:exodeoxyribonuclease III